MKKPKFTVEQKRAILREQETIVKDIWRAYQQQPTNTQVERAQQEKIGWCYVRACIKCAKLRARFKVGFDF